MERARTLALLIRPHSKKGERPSLQHLNGDDVDGVGAKVAAEPRQEPGDARGVVLHRLGRARLHELLDPNGPALRHPRFWCSRIG